MLVDPCTPKGYSHSAESLKLSPGSFGEKNTLFSTLRPKGNFSECRSAALMMLQNGKGCKFSLYSIVEFCVMNFSFLKLFVNNYV